MAQFSFDTSTAPVRENNFELLPAGWYTAQAVESEIVPLKSGQGQSLKLTFEVLQDGYRGRKVWARLNVRHSGSPEAERIANEQLGELCRSVGLGRMQDTAELHNKPVQIRVKIREDKSGQYEPQNEVIGYKPAAGSKFMETSAGARAVILPASAGSAPVAAASAPPWAKKAA